MKVEIEIPDELALIAKQFEDAVGISLPQALQRLIPQALRSFDIGTLIASYKMFIR